MVAPEDSAWGQVHWCSGLAEQGMRPFVVCHRVCRGCVCISVCVLGPFSWEGDSCHLCALGDIPFFITVNVAWKPGEHSFSPNTDHITIFLSEKNAIKQPADSESPPFLFLSVLLFLWATPPLSLSFCPCVSLYQCLCLWGLIYSLKCFYIFTLSIESVPVIQKETHIQVCNEISALSHRNTGQCSSPLSYPQILPGLSIPPSPFSGFVFPTADDNPPICPPPTPSESLSCRLPGGHGAPGQQPPEQPGPPRSTDLGTSSGREPPESTLRIHFPKLSQCKHYPQGKGSRVSFP